MLEEKTENKRAVTEPCDEPWEAVHELIMALLTLPVLKQLGYRLSKLNSILLI